MTSQTESKKPFNIVLELVTWNFIENKIISELLTQKNKNYKILELLTRIK